MDLTLYLYDDGTVETPGHGFGPITIWHRTPKTLVFKVAGHAYSDHGHKEWAPAQFYVYRILSERRGKRMPATTPAHERREARRLEDLQKPMTVFHITWLTDFTATKPEGSVAAAARTDQRKLQEA